MRVSILCRLNAHRPGAVYASVYSAEAESGQEGALLISATLDYCLSACAERGYEIENGHEALMWLHKNSEFKGHPAA